MRTADLLRLAAVAGGLGLGTAQACDPIEDFQDTPFVAKSADAEPRWTVAINRVREGVYTSYRPRCLEVRLGQTVEFRNFQPDIPANVTGLEPPAPLYSPNLVWPYNYVASDDPDNDVCDEFVAGECTSRPPFSYWRHTFDVAGAYDWLDTNQGEPGRRVVDPYYGTVTFVGIDPDSPLGTVCVLAADGTGCQSVCCTSDADCVGTTRCFKSEFDTIGRCLIPSG